MQHDPWMEGYDAYWEGSQISDNPYDKSFDQWSYQNHMDWETGWSYAHKDDLADCEW